MVVPNRRKHLQPQEITEQRAAGRHRRSTHDSPSRRRISRSSRAITQAFPIGRAETARYTSEQGRRPRAAVAGVSSPRQRRPVGTPKLPGTQANWSAWPALPVGVFAAAMPSRQVFSTTGPAPKWPGTRANWPVWLTVAVSPAALRQQSLRPDEIAVFACQLVGTADGRCWVCSLGRQPDWTARPTLTAARGRRGDSRHAPLDRVCAAATAIVAVRGTTIERGIT